MGKTTGIEWTDATWNPVVGCDHVSEGCRNCYAESMSARLAGADHSPQYDDVLGEGGRFAGGAVNIAPSQLDKPLHWTKPRRIFVCSMSDLFHPDVPPDYIQDVFHVMRRADQHTYQVLTKRPRRMSFFFEEWCPYLVDEGGEEVEFPLPNVWLGTSVENQQTVEIRIPHLLQTPASVRFVSCEPLLDHVDLLQVSDPYDEVTIWFPLEGKIVSEGMNEPARLRGDSGGLDWVIAGGESGPNARPMHPMWAWSLMDQCRIHNVPYFFKQWGAWRPIDHDTQTDNETCWLTIKGEINDRWIYERDSRMERVGKHVAGRELEGETWTQFPEPPPHIEAND